MRPPELRLDLDPDELIVDSFAGGGGASMGIEMALGRSPDIAINHDAEAIALHKENHPNTRHYCEDVWKVDPVLACGGRRVGLMWLSPDCKHFSKAKGGKPVEKKIRGLAWLACRWAAAVRPRVIVLENVEEFTTWGPLDENNMPCKVRKGLTFRRYIKQLNNLGYTVDWQILRACDYGAPTIRKRLFMVTRCDGQPIIWPDKTHGPGLIPYRTAAECIDWSAPCPSIFERAKPLADNTLRRIARGLFRYVINCASPFIVPTTHQGDARTHGIDEPLRTITGAQRGEMALVSPYLAGVGGRKGQSPETPVDQPYHTVTAKADTVLVAPYLARIGQTGGNGKYANDLRDPLTTITSKNEHLLVSPTLIQMGYGEAPGQQPRVPGIDKPLGTVVAGGGTHIAEVRAFLIKYYGTDQDPKLTEPLHTIPTKDRFGLVTVHGHEYVIADIGMRMLMPRELFTAQGFPTTYKIDTAGGKPVTKTAQIRMCGNSVSPPNAAAIIRAQFYRQEIQVGRVA